MEIQLISYWKRSGGGDSIREAIEKEERHVYHNIEDMEFIKFQMVSSQTIRIQYERSDPTKT